jgi:ferrous iron transport protein B
LTGGSARVGNFPGITVDILESDVALPDGRTATIVDLPGLYSIESVVDPKTDEGVARAFIESMSATRPRLIVQVVDATQLAWRPSPPLWRARASPPVTEPSTPIFA